jgi:hypothetical protein
MTFNALNMFDLINKIGSKWSQEYERWLLEKIKGINDRSDSTGNIYWHGA